MNIREHQRAYLYSQVSFPDPYWSGVREIMDRALWYVHVHVYVAGFANPLVAFALAFDC